MSLSKTQSAAEKRVGGGPSGPPHAGASAHAKRLAAVILEVLAGVRSPAEAAQALGLSTARYYMLEQRALDGLVAACEPRGRGPGPSLEREIAQLRRTNEHLENERARYQALARASQKTVGLGPPPPPRQKSRKSGKRTRKHRPAVRALRAADRLKQGIPADAGTARTTATAETDPGVQSRLADQKVGA